MPHFYRMKRFLLLWVCFKVCLRKNKIVKDPKPAKHACPKFTEQRYKVIDSALTVQLRDFPFQMVLRDTNWHRRQVETEMDAAGLLLTMISALLILSDMAVYSLPVYKSETTESESPYGK